MRLQGKVTLITGASSGIGAATARRFAAEGADVVLAARRRDALEEVAHAVSGAGRRAAVVPCDVTDPEQCRAAVRQAVESMGSLDILFNNAGIIYREKTVPATPVEEWDRTFDVNIRGTFLMSKAALEVMLRQGSGNIVNNASYFGLVGGRGVAAYAASKGAVVLLTRSMALDHAGDGIRVNCVCAGSVDTPMLQREMEESGDPLSVRRRFARKHPLGRISTPEEIAAAVVYLASDEAAFVTGVAFPVDGGLTAG